MGDRGPTAGQVVDSWRPYFDLRRNALRDLAHQRGLQYFGRPGFFGALPRYRSEAGGGLWALGPDAEQPLTAALRSAEPDWVALAEPALPLLPVVLEQGLTTARTFRAMALTDLSSLPPAEPPPTVVLQRVELADLADGVSLEEALLVDVLHGDTDALSAPRDLPSEVGMLRRLQGISLHAAVDAGGNCVGTAGCRVIGGSALICAVATIPAYRQRGIATALTLAAIDGARRTGARRAFLDASAGDSMYALMGFTALGTVVRCERPTAQVAAG